MEEPVHGIAEEIERGEWGNLQKRLAAGEMDHDGQCRGAVKRIDKDRTAGLATHEVQHIGDDGESEIIPTVNPDNITPHAEAFQAVVWHLIVSHPSLAPGNMKELVEYVRARPGAINYSSGGAGGAGHLNFEMMNHSFGLKFVHVPYKGIGAALTAVMSGEVQLSGVPVPVALPQVKAGKVKAYATTSKNRFAGAPDIPTVAEAGFPGFDASTWFAMFAPARTPPDIVRTLNRDMVGIIGSPAVRTWLITQGAEPAPGTPEALTAFLKSDIEKWGKVIRAAGIKAE